MQDFCVKHQAPSTKHQAPSTKHQAPKFSIIIPVYNVALYLRTCLDSVLAQTFTDWEAICVDDGSTDGSGAILDEYAAKDSRFRVIRQPNAGVSVARNAALDHVCGEWFCFLDADDLVTENWLSVSDAATKQYASADWVQFVAQHFEDGSLWKPVSRQSELTPIDLARHVPHVVVMGQIYEFFYLREKFASERFERGVKIGEDRLFVGVCLRRANLAVKTQSVLYGYRQRQNSAIHSVVTLKYATDEVRCWCKRLRWLFEDGRLIDRFTIRLMIQWETEAASSRYFDLCKSDHAQYAAIWFDSLRELRPYVAKMPRWNACVVRVLNRFPLIPLSIILCYVPIWLKMHGVHR